MFHHKKIEDFQEKIGYVFQNDKLIMQAFTHSSFSNEQKINRLKNYERLEFLGDAVLELVSSHYFYEEYPDMTEGEMTKIRSSMVCEPALAYCARKISLEHYILLGKGEENTGGRFRDSIISDVMESVIGALYLDGGLETARDFIHRYILSDIEDKKLFYDSKTILQEQLQQGGNAEIQYVLVSESGPEHDKEFLTRVCLNDKVIGEGRGGSKKSAEQEAAYQALKHMKTGENEKNRE